MRYHHTKNKGDLGALHAMADMAQKGYSVFVPLSEHEPFDFVAYRDGKFLRVQAKYRAVTAGSIRLQVYSNWTDRNGTHHVALDRNALDLICIYCPDNKTCYYVDSKLVLDHSSVFSLRVEPTRNSQSKAIRWAKDFLEIPSTVHGVSAGFGYGLVEPGGVRHSREPGTVTWNWNVTGS